MVFYKDFESTLKNSFSYKIAELNPYEDYPNLILENNSIKVESEKIKTLDITYNLIKDLYKSIGLENIQIGKLNFQNKYIARVKMNVQFNTSRTNIIFATKLDLNKIDIEGIHNTSEILNLSSESENKSFSWPEEKDFLLIKNQNKYLRILKRIFVQSGTPNYPIIRRRQIFLDEFDKQLVYYVTIDGKWRIPYSKSVALFEDAKVNFFGFLDVWNDTNPKAGVKYRFKNSAFRGIVIQDGIISKNYAKQLSFF